MIYARYSSDNQREESIKGQIGNTLPTQKNGITVINPQIDRVLSVKTDNLPDFQRLLFPAGSSTIAYFTETD